MHTPTSPYCQKLMCWCHTDVAYHDQVTHHQASEDEIAQAYRFLGLDMCSWPAPFAGLSMGATEQRVCA